jgi:hypothetical protein
MPREAGTPAFREIDQRANQKRCSFLLLRLLLGRRLGTACLGVQEVNLILGTMTNLFLVTID